MCRLPFVGRWDLTITILMSIRSALSSVVGAYHPYIFRESSVTTLKLFKIQSQSLSIDVVIMPTWRTGLKFFHREPKLNENMDNRSVAPVVQTLDSAIHRINHYPADSVIGFPNTYPLDSDLSGGKRYPMFEQLGLGPLFSIFSMQSPNIYEYNFPYFNISCLFVCLFQLCFVNLL